MYSKKQIGLGLTAIGLSLMSALVVFSPAIAQPSDDGQQGGGPGPGPGPRGLRRGPGGGLGGHMRAPKEEDVLALPGLTADQKTNIQSIYAQEKKDLAPLRKQLKAANPGGPGGGAGAGGGKATAGGAGLGNGQGMELFQQVRGIRKANWDKVKALLTPEQLAALKPSGPPHRPGGGGPGGPGGPSGGPAGAPAGGPMGPPEDEQ